MSDFKAGNSVFYHNRWTNFDNKEIADLFIPLTREEIEMLVVGDYVWTDDEPYHPAGKVYGFTYNEIIDISQSEGNYLFYFKSEALISDELRSFSSWPQIPIYRVKDVQELKELILKFPAACSI